MIANDSKGVVRFRGRDLLKKTQITDKIQSKPHGFILLDYSRIGACVKFLVVGASCKKRYFAGVGDSLERGPVFEVRRQSIESCLTLLRSQTFLV